MKNWLRYHWPAVVICLFAAMIMIPGLSRPFFWQDEAETALLARSILKNRVPYAFDGTNLVTQLSGNDSNSSYVWSFTPWLPFYIVAASFKMLGETNFTGRLPFVIIAIISLGGLYLLVFSLTRNRSAAILSSMFLLLNMQFILYSRQCKYYSILFLIPPLMYLAYSRLHKSIWSIFLFVVCIVIMFYTNYVSLFTSLIGITAYTFFIRRKRREIISFIAAGVVSLLLTIPFFFIGDFGVSSALISSLPSVAEYVDKLARHILYFNNLAFALVLFIPLGIFARKKLFLEDEAKLVRLVLWIIFPAWVVLPLFNQDVFRYNLHLLPLCCVLAALMTIALFRWSKVAGVIFLVLFLTTNIFANFPVVFTKSGLKAFDVRFKDKAQWVSKTFNKDVTKTRKYFGELDKDLDELTVGRIFTHSVLKSEYAAYFNELRGDYPDAIEAMVGFLKENARYGDVVYGNFDQLSLMFYLPHLRYSYVVDMNKLQIAKDPPFPDYISFVAGVNWYYFHDVKMNLGPYIVKGGFEVYIMLSGGTLIAHDLGISSLYWDVNWPQRYYQYINKMLWKDTRGYDNVVVYGVK